MANTLLLVGTLLLSAFQLARNADECSSYTRCRECISLNPNCAWCDDVNVFQDYANTSRTLEPAPLCGLESDLLTLGCQNIVNPQSNSTTNAPADTNATVSVSSAQVKVRPGQASEVDIGVSPAESIAVDMYLLMDLSLTMQQDLSMLRMFAGTLVERMKQISNDFRIGFGSFIDKTVAPFADTINTAFPCAADAQGLNIPRDQCGPIYAYRHRLDFTSNASSLQEELDNAQLSASPDHPESLLDALLQVATCENEIGWRVKGQSRRIVVAITDGDYHYALDGKLGGIVSPPDTQCRLSPTTHEYEDSHRYDYPSSSFISDILNENRITPIFVVPSQVQSVYDRLAAAIRSASVGTLSADGSGIITLIEDQYRILSATIVPLLSTSPEDISSDLLNITVLPMGDCSPGNLRPNTSDVCENVMFPDTVTYRVQVSVSPDACDVLGNQPISAQIQFIGFGIVNINVSLSCDCNCSDPEPNSPMCSGAGTFECSTCICNDEKIGGVQCTCPIGVGAELGCSDPLNPQSPECNGVGRCECGKCMCDRISNDSVLVFEGPYCQYNPINCPVARDDNGDFKPCAGHGMCINSRCECNDDFTGGACECTLDNSTCRSPSAPRGDPLCSEAGDCQCGLCICSNYSLTFGQYCEDCVPCRTSCSRVSPCVRCSLLDGEVCSDECAGRISFVNDTSAIPDAEGIKLCSVREGTCEVRYRISTDVRGDEPIIYAAVDMNQRSLSLLRSGSSDCNPAPLIWPIFVGIILAIIIVGILAIILWRCCTYLGEYLEYRQWVHSVHDESSRTGDNPLFVDPNAKYQNPRYRQSTN